MKKIKLTFKQWCENHNRFDLLDRWDYEKTGFRPEDITYASAKPVYFKCPKGIHESEARKVYVITTGAQQNFVCTKCNNECARDIKDHRGQRFGELTVLDIDREKTKKHNEAYWMCQCSCGAIKSIRGASLRNGSIVTCGNRKIHWSGSNASNWRGGVTPINIGIRNSLEYDNWRQGVLAKDGYKCQICGTTKKLEAHHIYPFATYISNRFNINYGITLCYSHHSMYADGSFHQEYGTYNNTPEQLEEYINNRRKQLGIDIPFDIYDYMKPKLNDKVS